MPLRTFGLVMHDSDIDGKIEKQITQVFLVLDKKIAEVSQARGLSRAHVKMLQPLHVCVFVADEIIVVIAAVHDIGGASQDKFVNWSGKPIDMQSAIFLTERDLGFNNAFGLQFKRSLLDLDDEKREAEIIRIATQYVNQEIVNMEVLSKAVRINPIFQGRGFFLNERLVFVLSPFAEPFNTVFSDHIKPSVERIKGLVCLRADDIYDNRPIIEDIWKCTNEARILISDLTGKNANVFYETGIAHTVGKEVILITQSMEDVPFDLRHLRSIVYDYTPRGIQKMEADLTSTILNILTRRRQK